MASNRGRGMPDDKPKANFKATIRLVYSGPLLHRCIADRLVNCVRNDRVERGMSAPGAILQAGGPAASPMAAVSLPLRKPALIVAGGMKRLQGDAALRVYI